MQLLIYEWGFLPHMFCGMGIVCHGCAHEPAHESRPDFFIASMILAQARGIVKINSIA